MPPKKYFWLRVSRVTAISCATTIAKLTENVSEAVNFSPTKGAAKIVLQILETIKEVDENDEARIALMKRVVNFLLEVRERFDNNIGIAPQHMSEKMQEFESVLFSIHNDMKPAEERSFARRVISRDKIKGDLAAHAAALDEAIRKLNFSLLLEVNATTHNTLTSVKKLSENIADLVHQSRSASARDSQRYYLGTECQGIQRILSSKSPKEDLLELLLTLEDYDYTGRLQISSQFIAGGTFANIFLGRLNDAHGLTTRRFAAKIIRVSFKTDFMTTNFKLRSVTSEMRIWSELNHPNILPFVGFVLEKNARGSECYPILISEWMENGSLSQYVQKGIKMNHGFMIRGIARGLRYLHRKGVVHGYLRSANVVISPSGDPLLMDFGISRMVCVPSTQPTEEALSGCLGAIRWMSPELLFPVNGRDDTYHSKESDVWAFGMTGLEVLTKSMPYDLLSQPQVVLAIVQGRIPPRPAAYQLWKGSDKYLWMLCESCWNFDARKRPTMDKILEEIRAIA